MGDTRLLRRLKIAISGVAIGGAAVVGGPAAAGGAAAVGGVALALTAVQHRKTSISNLEHALRETIRQMEDLQSAQFKTQGQLAEAKKRTSLLQGAQEEARRQATAAHKSAEEAQAKSDEQARKLQTDVKRLQALIQEADGKAASLESDLSELRNKVKSEKEQAEEARHTLAHKAAVAKLSSDVAQARSTVMMQQAVLCSLEKQLKESSATVLTLNQDLTSAQDAHNSAMQALQNEVKQLKQQLGHSEEAAAANKAQMRQVEAELRQTTSSLVTTAENLAAAKTTHLHAVQALEGEVSQLKEQARRSEQSSAATKVEVGQLEGKLEHATSSLVTVAGDLATNQSTLSEAIQTKNAEIAALNERTAKLEAVVQRLSQQQQAADNNPGVSKAGEARTSSAGLMKTDCDDLIAAHYTKVCDAELKAARASGGVDGMAHVTDLASPAGVTPDPQSCSLQVCEAKDSVARALTPAGAVDDAPALDLACPNGFCPITTAATDPDTTSQKVDGGKGAAAMAPPPAGAVSDEAQASHLAHPAASTPITAAALKPAPALHKMIEAEDAAARVLAPAGALDDDAQAADLACPADSSSTTPAATPPTPLTHKSCTAAPVVPPAPAQSLAKKTPKSKSGKGKKAGSSGIGSKVCKADETAARASAPDDNVKATALEVARPAGIDAVTTAATDHNPTAHKVLEDAAAKPSAPAVVADGEAQASDLAHPASLITNCTAAAHPSSPPRKVPADTQAGGATGTPPVSPCTCCPGKTPVGTSEQAPSKTLGEADRHVASPAKPPTQTQSVAALVHGKTSCEPLSSHTATPSCPTPASNDASIQAELETPGPNFFGPLTKLVSPGWDAVARSKATADAEACGKVWDGEFTMVPLPGNDCIRTLDSDKLRLVARGGQGMVL
ncbi:hypothetical protein ABBQ38_004732 [Trebouxia sp. C0009 RCD-2024]